jgi:hypothetical protein
VHDCKNLFLILLTIASCGKKAEVSSGAVIAPPVYSVTDLQKYVLSFEQKMLAAGSTGDITGLILEFDTDQVMPANVLGSCGIGTDPVTLEIVLRRIRISTVWSLMTLEASSRPLPPHALQITPLSAPASAGIPCVLHIIAPANICLHHIL